MVSGVINFNPLILWVVLDLIHHINLIQSYHIGSGDPLVTIFLQFPLLISWFAYFPIFFHGEYSCELLMRYTYLTPFNFILIEQITMPRPQYILEVIHHNYVPNILNGVYFPLFLWTNLLINHMKCQVYDNSFFVFFCDTYCEGVPQKYI